MIGINLIPSRLNVLCNIECLNELWRRGGLMVSVLNSGSSGLGSSPARGHCVVFLGKTLYSHSASTNGYQQMCYGLTSHPGGSSNTPFKPLHTKKTGVKHRPHGPLGPV